MIDLDRLVGGLRCRDVLALLPEYLDDELTPEELSRVRAHLEGCDVCEKFGGEYGELVTALRAGRVTPAPTEPGVRQRLAERMARFWIEHDV